MKVSTDSPVSEIMTKKLITIKTSEGLDKAEHLFKKHKIRHIPVLKDRELKGMLSMNDLLRISFADGAYREEDNISSSIYEMFTIPQLMIGNLITVPSATSIKEVAEIFIKREFHSLPVVDDGELVGMVTTTDVIKYLLENC